MKFSYVSFLRILSFVFLIGFSTNAFSQQIRYVKTDYIDKNGNRLGASAGAGSRVRNFKISGQRISEQVSHVGGPHTFSWQYHHRDSNNSVYYIVAYDAFYGKESLNSDGVIVISADWSLMNEIHYFRGERLYTIVYHQQDEEKHDSMAY